MKQADIRRLLGDVDEEKVMPALNKLFKAYNEMIAYGGLSKPEQMAIANVFVNVMKNKRDEYQKELAQGEKVVASISSSIEEWDK